MHCAFIEHLIDGYLDGELPVPIAEAFEQHLSHCDVCRGDCGKLVAFLRAPRTLSVPDALRKQVLSSLEPASTHREAMSVPAGRA